MMNRKLMMAGLVSLMALAAACKVRQPDEGGTMGEPGQPGTPGAPGENCWDLNRNGTLDLDEDRAEPFGEGTPADCQGSEGPMGMMGLPGDGSDCTFSGVSDNEGRQCLSIMCTNTSTVICTGSDCGRVTVAAGERRGDEVEVVCLRIECDQPETCWFRDANTGAPVGGPCFPGDPLCVCDERGQCLDGGQCVSTATVSFSYCDGATPPPTSDCPAGQRGCPCLLDRYCDSPMLRCNENGFAGHPEKTCVVACNMPGGECPAGFICNSNTLVCEPGVTDAGVLRDTGTPPDSGANECTRRLCGDRAPSGCACDRDCAVRGDCCPGFDYTVVCMPDAGPFDAGRDAGPDAAPDASMDASIDSGPLDTGVSRTCSGNCGGVGTGSGPVCFCDIACTRQNPVDCCPDYTLMCVAAPPDAGPGGPDAGPPDSGPLSNDWHGRTGEGQSGAGGGPQPDNTPDCIDNDLDCYSETTPCMSSANPACLVTLAGDCDDNPTDDPNYLTFCWNSSTNQSTSVPHTSSCPSGYTAIGPTDGSAGNNPGASDFPGDNYDNNCNGNVDTN